MITNHFTYSLSALDILMLVPVKQGGNWKDIPLDISTKRLDTIRKTGGRTTLYGRLDYNKPSYTITTCFNRPGNGCYIHPTLNRTITPREAMRIQSFPDYYHFLGVKTSIRTQIGNAVPPLLSFVIASYIKKYLIKNYKENSFECVDLFCGAGGFGLGFILNNFKIDVANDINVHALKTYAHNHKETPVVCGDITQKEIKDNIYEIIDNKKIDVIFGGPPCQGFSMAGKRLSDDPRNFLFKEFVEIIKNKKPKCIVMENVLGIVTSNKGKTFESIQEEFKEHGYHLKVFKINTVDYGVPQKRKRVIIIGTLKENTIELNPLIALNNSHQIFFENFGRRFYKMVFNFHLNLKNI